MIRFTIYVFVFVFSGCTTSETKKVPNACFQYTNGKDTVSLTLISPSETLQGDLVYDYFEKDRNEGTLSGNINDSSLVASYLFSSEGIQSKREVAFKKVGHTWVEAFGEMRMVGDEMRFINLNSLDYNSGIVLKPIDCKDQLVQPGPKQ